MDTIIAKFEFKPKWTAMMPIILLFGPATALYTYWAIYNDVALSINGIELSVNGATIFYWVLAAFSGLFTLAGLVMLYNSLTKGISYLTFYENDLTLPAQLFRKEIHIPYEDIISFEKVNIAGQKMIQIQLIDNKPAIAHSMLKSDEVYEQVWNLLQKQTS